MFNLYKVNVYKKLKMKNTYAISYLDSIIVNVLPEGIPFNRVNEFCTGKPLTLVNSMDDKEFKYDNTELVVFKNELNKDNSRKLNDELMTYYVDSFEDSQFNKFISSLETEKVKKKEMD